MSRLKRLTTISNCVITTSTLNHSFNNGKCLRSQRRILLTNRANGATKLYDALVSECSFSWSISKFTKNVFGTDTEGDSTISFFHTSGFNALTGFRRLPAITIPWALGGSFAYRELVSLMWELLSSHSTGFFVSISFDFETSICEYLLH